LDKEKTKNLNKAAIKSGSGYMLSNILIRSSAIITAPIFTRLLTTSDYGIASNFAAWLNIGLVVIGLGLPYSIGNAKMDFPSELNKFLASIQTLGSIFAISFLIIAIVFKSQLGKWMELDPSLVIIMFVYLLFQPSVLYMQERYKFELLYKENIFISIINSIGAIVFCFLFILYVFNNQRYFGRIGGLIFPMFLMGIFYYFKIIRDGWEFHIKKYWSYALKISIPMIPHALAMVVLTQIDRIMIINICGNSEAGIYSFGFQYAVLLLIFSNAVLQAYNPWLYTSYSQNNFKSIRSSNMVIVLIMSVLTLLIVTAGPEAIKILGSRDFWDAKLVVMPIAIGALFQYVYNTYSSLELYHKKTIVIAIGTVFAAIINYILNSKFIPIYGYVAAAYTTSASYLVLALFHLIAYRRICKKQVYNDRYIWLIVIGTVLISFLMMMLYDYILLRYIILFFILSIVGLTQKKKLIAIFKLISGKDKSFNIS